MKTTISIKDVKSLLLWLTEVEASYTLVGGLAVSLWAETCLTEEAQERLGLPIFSKDLDFRGVRFLAEGIKSWLSENGMRSASLTVAQRKNSEHMGKIYNFPFSPMDSTAPIQAQGTIEILERLPLLDAGLSHPKSGRTVSISNIHVLDPVSLLICKLHAFHTRPDTEKGNDLHHIAILSGVIEQVEKKGLCQQIDLSQEALKLKEVLRDNAFPWPLSEKELENLMGSINTFLNPRTLSKAGQAKESTPPETDRLRKKPEDLGNKNPQLRFQQ